MMNLLFKFVSKYPKAILTTLVVISFVFGVAIFDMTVQSNWHSFVKAKYISSLDYIQEHLGVKRSQSITLEALNGQSILSIPLLREQSRLFNEIQKKFPVEVQSLAGLINLHILTLQELVHGEGKAKYNIYDIDDQEDIDNLIASLYMVDPYEFERVIRKAVSDEGFIDTMQAFKVLSAISGALSSNVQFELPVIKATRASIVLKEKMTKDESRRVFAEIRDFTEGFSPTIKIRHYSAELVDTDIDERIIGRSPLVILCMIILLAIVLLYSFRSWFFTLIPLIVLSLTVIWIFGFFSLIGIKEVSYVHIIAIPLLLGQCIDNLIHFNERFREEHAKMDKKEALRVVFNTSGKAAGLTTLVNMTAFTIDFFYESLWTLKQYLLIIILGIGLALVLTYLMGGAAFLLAKIPQTKNRTPKLNLDFDVKKLFDFLNKHKLSVLVVFLGLFAFMVSNALKVDTSFRATSFMSKSFPSYDAYEFERKNFALYIPHYVLLKGNVATQKALDAIDAIEKRMDMFKDIEHIHNKVNTESLSYLISKFDPKSFPKSIPELFDKLKHSDELINPILGQTAKDVFSEVTETDDSQYPATIIRFWPVEKDSKTMAYVANELETAAKEYARPLSELNTRRVNDLSNLDDKAPLYVQTAGDFLSFSRTFRDVLDQFVQSTILIIVIIMFYLWRAFKRWASVFITIIPVLFGLTVAIGSLTLFNTELNPLNGCIGALVVGLGIDYAIQIMSRYNEELTKHKTPVLAMRECFSSMAIPLVNCAFLTSFSLIILVALLPVTGKFGIVSGISIFSAYLASVLVMPILAVSWVKK